MDLPNTTQGFEAILVICDTDIHRQDNGYNYCWKNFRSWTLNFLQFTYTALNELRNGL